MITPYGAVLEQNTPSPWEVLKQGDEMGLKDQAVRIKRAELAAKLRKDADDNHERLTKPLREYKINTGITGTDQVKPDLVVGKKAEETMAAVEKMYREGKSDSEINQYVAASVRDLDVLQNSFKNGMSDLEKQLATVKEGDGVDQNKVRDLMTLELLGRKPGADNGNLLIDVLKKYPDALNVNNAGKLYDFPKDSVPNTDYYKAKGSDGTIGFRQIQTKYNGRYQELRQNPDYSFEVVTKSEPATIGGKEVKVLPEDAYIDFTSNIGRKVELEKGVKRELGTIKKQYEYDALRQASNQLDQKYGMSLKSIPVAKRLSMQKDLANQILSTMEVPDEEVVRRKVAFDQADERITKEPVNAQQSRNPNYSYRTTINTGDKTKVYNPVYQKIVGAADATGNIPMSSLNGSIQEYIIKKVNNIAPGSGSRIWDKSFRQGDVKLKKEADGTVNIYDKQSGQVIAPLEQVQIDEDFNNTAPQRQEIIKDNPNGPKPPPKAAGKTITTAEYKKMSPAQRQQFLADGGQYK